ncbi:MAG: hypothetical protein IIA61_03245 [Candidatus Marinimicrobia bacterium]|nr:hypothetical protein [Candidatus Neomarinimicrobiota bacterium]
MKAIRICMMCVIFYLGACSFFADPDQPNLRDANPQLDDPLRAFENIPREGRVIKFRWGNTEFPDGGHFQGIQSFYDSSLKKQICFISRSSDSKAYFITVAFNPGPQSFGEIRHFQYLPSDGNQPPLRHPGGIQLIGKYLVVGVEDNQNKRRSQVQFWDVSDPFAPKQRTPLTVIRESATPKDKTAGTVGIVKRANDHLLVVANWDSKALDFYASNGLPLGDDACRFTFTVRWTSDEANKGPWAPNENWGNYQGINLVCDRNFNIFLLGFKTNSIGKDFIDLFSVDLAKDPPNIIYKLSTKHMILKGGVHFRNSGGIFIKSSTELSCYATERDDHGETNVNVSP